MNSGIYSITNIVNGKQYVGSAVNISRRWNNHRFNLRNNKHPNKHLQSSWNKYGEQSFIFVVETEKMRQSQLGKTLSEETKSKMSISQTGSKNPRYGKTLSEETKNKMRLAHLGKCLTEEHKRKLVRFGTRHTEETKEKIRQSHIGKTVSEETKQKMSIAKRNMSEQTKQKMSIAKRNMSEETKQKIRIANIGRKHSEESKQKMRIANSKRGV